MENATAVVNPTKAAGTLQQVTLATLNEFAERYHTARGGVGNQDTDSEAAFVYLSQYGGAYVLFTGMGIFWIGLQNSSARWTNNGRPFSDVRDALYAVLECTDPVHSVGGGLFYAENSVELLSFVAERVRNFKACGSFMVSVSG